MLFEILGAVQGFKGMKERFWGSGGIEWDLGRFKRIKGFWGFGTKDSRGTGRIQLLLSGV